MPFAERAEVCARQIDLRRAIILLAGLAALAVAPYGWTPLLPFISDDYMQIGLARDFISADGWRNLAADPLYRCRATSLVITRVTEALFGLREPAYMFSSLLLHVLNTWLVLALGTWRAIGWKASAVAAAFFAVYEGHQEAVVWYAALPELLVFFFGLASFLAWLKWLERGRGLWLALAVAAFVLALASKESAVALLAVFLLPAWPLRREKKWLLAWLSLCLVAGAYAVFIFLGTGYHQHLHDGTFSKSAPFPFTVLHSMGRMLWFWGGLGLLAVLARRRAGYGPLALTGLAWMAFTLLPYSFLTYMTRVPSRHTYLASAGLALIVAAGFLTLWRSGRRRALVALAAILVVHNAAYLWTKKRAQFEERAQPTERLIRFAAGAPSPVFVHCFSYGLGNAEYVLRVRLGMPFRPADLNNLPRGASVFCEGHGAVHTAALSP